MKKPITNLEKLVLIKKYQATGRDFTDACEEVNKHIGELKNLQIKLIKQNKSEEEQNKIFKQEFEKLCRRLEI